MAPSVTSEFPDATLLRLCVLTAHVACSHSVTAFDYQQSGFSMECRREHEQRVHASTTPAQDSTSCTATCKDSTKGSSPPEGGEVATNESNLRYTVVRLLEKLSVLETRQFETAAADSRTEQAKISAEDESDLPQSVHTGLLGMWQAYLGAGYVLQAAIRDASLSNTTILPSLLQCHKPNDRQRGPPRRIKGCEVF